jgi:hypothetical protein
MESALKPENRWTKADFFKRLGCGVQSLEHSRVSGGTCGSQITEVRAIGELDTPLTLCHGCPHDPTTGNVPKLEIAFSQFHIPCMRHDLHLLLIHHGYIVPTKMQYCQSIFLFLFGIRLKLRYAGVHQMAAAFHPAF